MNFLIIDHYAGSPEMGMEYRPYYFAKEWIKRGHTVTIVAADYSHLRSRQPEVSRDLQKENIDGVNYMWIKTIKYNSSGIKRILNILIFTAKLIIKSRKIAKISEPEIVVASSTYPLDIYPADRIARLRKARLVYEVHDLWPLSPVELGGYSKYHPFIIVMQLAENYAYKHCYKVISVLPLAKQHMIEHGLPDEKFYHVPNGIILRDWENPKGLPENHKMLIDKLKNEGRFLVGYSGAHGVANSLGTIIDAVADLLDHNIALVLIGKGEAKKELITYVEKRKFKNIYFLDPIDKFAIPSFLMTLDILIISLKKAPLFRFGISPNKIFDYMMAAKPIIQAIEAGNNIVSEAECGFCVDPDSSEAIGAAILKLQSMSEDERRKLGENGYAFVNKYHTYNVLAENFINAIK